MYGRACPPLSPFSNLSPSPRIDPLVVSHPRAKNLITDSDPVISWWSPIQGKKAKSEPGHLPSPARSLELAFPTPPSTRSLTSLDVPEPPSIHRALQALPRRHRAHLHPRRGLRTDQSRRSPPLSQSPPAGGRRDVAPAHDGKRAEGAFPGRRGPRGSPHAPCEGRSARSRLSLSLFLPPSPAGLEQGGACAVPDSSVRDAARARPA